MPELLHDVLLVKAGRSKGKQWYGLNGRKKLLFVEAVSKQWSAWHENAGATVTPPAEAKVMCRTLKEVFQDRVMQSRFVLVDKKRGQEHSRESIGYESIRSHGGSWIRRSRCVGHHEGFTNSSS